MIQLLNLPSEFGDGAAEGFDGDLDRHLFVQIVPLRHLYFFHVVVFFLVVP